MDNDLELKINNIENNFLDKNTNNSHRSLKKLLISTINNLTYNYGLSINPFISGKYVIYNINGPWFNTFVKAKYNDIGIISDKSFFIKNKFNTQSSTSKMFSLLATDIDIPEPNKEYINVSSRTQTLTHYQRETILPDFSISYVEDNSMFVVRYHEAWHKMIELYRRGKFKIGVDSMTSSSSPYFYQVPYSNGMFVLIFDTEYQVRGLIYLVGIRPVTMPLKQVIGNRSSSKMTVYNISYKLTNMYYKFFSNNTEFFDYISNNNNNILATIFKTQVLTAK